MKIWEPQKVCGGDKIVMLNMESLKFITPIKISQKIIHSPKPIFRLKKSKAEICFGNQNLT